MTDQFTKIFRHCLHREFSKLPISILGNENDNLFFDKLSMWTIKYLDVVRNDNSNTMVESGILDVSLKNYICEKYNEPLRKYLIMYRIILKLSDPHRPKCYLEILS